MLLDHNGELVTDSMRQMDLLIGQVGVEFCTPGGRRTSLDALGLAAVSYELNKFSHLLREFAPILPWDDTSSTERLALLLLETIRREKVIHNLWDVDLRDEFHMGATLQGRFGRLVLNKERHVRYAWLTHEGAKYHNRRTWFLTQQLGFDDHLARDVLAAFWEAALKARILTVCASRLRPWMRKLIRIASGHETPIFLCRNCGLRQRNVVRGKCSAFRCDGSTRELSEKQRAAEKFLNHYVRTYELGKAATLRAKEHTASLSTDLREKIEKRIF